MVRIKKGVFFVVVFGLLFLFTFCILLYSQQQKRIDELSNQFYTKNHAVFLDSDLNKWLKIEADYRLFIEYNDTFRYFYQHNDDWSPPVEKGRFFQPGEEGNKALVGREVQDQIYVKKGKEYIDFQEVMYEVIGIIGDSFQSHVDYLILLSSPQVPKSPSAQIVVDSDSYKHVKKIKESMENKYESVVEIEQSNRGIIKSASSGLFGNFFIISSILLSLFTVTFYLRYWYELELNKINLHFLLGIPIIMTVKSLLIKVVIYICLAIITSNVIFLIANPRFTIDRYLDMIIIQILALVYSIILIILFLWVGYCKNRSEVVSNDL